MSTITHRIMGYFLALISVVTKISTHKNLAAQHKKLWVKFLQHKIILHFFVGQFIQTKNFAHQWTCMS